MLISKILSSAVFGQGGKPDVYRRVLALFPDGIEMAFAYGSGVFQQTGQEMSKNMLDFILVVDKTEDWHRQNLQLNSNHYSFLSKFGANCIARFQDNFGAGVYFNTLVPFENRLIKYGVISTDKLINDLRDWETLYVSGRLHKPVRFVVSPQSKIIRTALQQNVESALHASLLLLPEKFTDKELFTTITSLSYSGDFRMTFGEDKGKVWKIVKPNMSEFAHLYQPIWEKELSVHFNSATDSFEQDLSAPSLLRHLNLLPKTVVNSLVCTNQSGNIDSLNILKQISTDPKYKEIVAQSIADIVKKSSWSQSIKGILTAGGQKTFKYSYSKVAKMFKGMKVKN